MKPTSFLDSLPAPFAIVGLGISGQSVLRLFQTLGLPETAYVTFDDKDPAAQIHDPEKLLQEMRPKTLIVSPGVPLSTPWIEKFKSAGGVITSELAIAFSFLKDECLVAVTGSVGKSTTVALLEKGVLSFSPDSFVGGNFGVPLANYVLDRLKKNQPKAPWIILELSSYQLENFSNLRANFSVLTYFTANHLERYHDLETYYQTKWSLLTKTTGPVFANRHGGDLFDFVHRQPEASQVIWTDRQDPTLDPLLLAEGRLLGAHNKDNLALAAKLALAAGWPLSSIAAMKSFSGLAHRLENLGQHGGIQFINDSKATTMESVLQATKSVLETVSISGALILLLGGRDKSLPWNKLRSLRSNAKLKFIFFGEFGSQASVATGLSGSVHESLQAALQALPHLAKPGDVVLLSPGGTSLDEFKSFEDRGNFFKNEISKRWS